MIHHPLYPVVMKVGLEKDDTEGAAENSFVLLEQQEG